MKKKLVALLLALALAFSLLPGAAFSAEPNLPDWYFLFAIFKNVDADCTDGKGTTTHTTYTMTRDEVDVVRTHAGLFEEYMNSFGVIRAHVEVVEINTPVTELADFTSGSYIGVTQAAPLLEAEGFNLDKYDHVTCVVSLNMSTGYLGITDSALFENGTGHSCINLINREYAVGYFTFEFKESRYVHEFLHFMERMNKKWGEEFQLHGLRYGIYDSDNDKGEACYTDIILNRAKGDEETGTGVSPVAWQYPPHVLRTMSEWTIPEGVTSIGSYAFRDLTNLEKVTIPTSVTKIEYAAFWNTGLTDVYYVGTEAQWKAIQFGEYNSALTKANVHCNRIAFSDVPASEYYANAVVWAVANGVTSGTGNGTFSPGQTCSQAQILTFLWRAKGEPAPKAAVSSNEYYAKAAQWAKEQGLTDDFSAEAPCTRAMVVTYLWKLAGSPIEGASSFTDVPAGSGYAQAVAWAVKNGVTSGTGNGAFSPDQTCTRAQIVTFLYRALGQ